MGGGKRGQLIWEQVHKHGVVCCKIDNSLSPRDNDGKLRDRFLGKFKGSSGQRRQRHITSALITKVDSKNTIWSKLSFFFFVVVVVIFFFFFGSSEVANSV